MKQSTRQSTTQVEVEQPQLNATKRYSWSEIVNHKSYNDCWIVVKGKVYDVTSWVPNHPGGRLILNGGGREATALFTSYHPLRVEQMLHKYEIGEVENYQSFYRWDNSDFYLVLKRRVEAYLRDNRLDKSSKLMYFKTLLIILGWCLFYYYGMIQGYILAALALGFVHSHFGINIAHDGNHGAYSKTPFLNAFAARAMDLMGASSIVWIHQHNIGHHPNSNRQGDSCRSESDQDDPDTRSGSPIVRMAPAQPYRWYHQWQHIYAWFLFCFVSMKWYLNDIKAFRKNQYVNIEFFEIKQSDYIFLAISKILYATYIFIIPLYFHSLLRTLVLFFVFSAMMSYCFVAMFSVNHLTTEAVFPNEAVTNRDWARLQVLTASNFAVGSEFWTWMSGGLNYQIEHHLFPYVCHVYLPNISPIVQQTCKEYNIPYQAFPSFWQAISSHYYLLKKLGHQNIEQKIK